MSERETVAEALADQVFAPREDCCDDCDEWLDELAEDADFTAWEAEVA